MFEFKSIVIISIVVIVLIIYLVKYLFSLLEIKLEKLERTTREQIFILSEKMGDYEQVIQSMKEQNKKMSDLYSLQKREDYVKRLGEEKINLKLNCEGEEILKTSEQELSPNNCFVLHSMTSKMDCKNETINEELNDHFNEYVNSLNNPSDKLSLSIESSKKESIIEH